MESSQYVLNLGLLIGDSLYLHSRDLKVDALKLIQEQSYLHFIQTTSNTITASISSLSCLHPSLSLSTPLVVTQNPSRMSFYIGDVTCNVTPMVLDLPSYNLDILVQNFVFTYIEVVFCLVNVDTPVPYRSTSV